MDVAITGLRAENKTSGHFRNYEVSDLLNKVDGVLTEHGFIGLGDSIDVETGWMYRIYKGSSGEAVVRFVTDSSKLIPYFIGGKEIVRCPVYVERLGVPDSIDNSIFKYLKKI